MFRSIIGAPLSFVNRHPFRANDHTPNMRDIPLRLRHARKHRGLTQVELATKSGVKQGSISDLERGESKSFRGETLLSLAKALNVSPEWLSKGQGTMEPQYLPLSDAAIKVAQAWQQLTPEMQKRTGDMILAMAAESGKYGPAVPDIQVERAYGKPGKHNKK
jgi:transcriptional regulator with XRE-family HTH domain